MTTPLLAELPDGLRERVARALGVSVADTCTMSLRALRELLEAAGRPKLARLVDEQTRVVRHEHGLARKGWGRW